MDEQAETIYVLHAEVLKCLAQPRRLMILDCLHGGEKSVGELAELLDMPQPNVSQHLAALRARNIVLTRREGNTIFYSLVDARLIKACDICREFLVERMKSNEALASRFAGAGPLRAMEKATPRGGRR
jgi:DNA-binding transcriptional ArsR family regulator